MYINNKLLAHMHIYSIEGLTFTTVTSTTQPPSTTNNDDMYLYRGKNTIIAQGRTNGRMNGTHVYMLYVELSVRVGMW